MRAMTIIIKDKKKSVIPYAPLTTSKLLVRKETTFKPVTIVKIIQVDFVGVTVPFIIPLI